MKCPWGCGWEGTPEEYIAHYSAKHEKLPLLAGALTLQDVSEKITDLLNQINLNFTPETAEDEMIIREVTKHITDAGFYLTRVLSRRPKELRT